ncbi:MAG: TspO/MBR family protein [Oscillospiraceae bacterium]|jgi:benzodiazapine receptor
MKLKALLYNLIISLGAGGMAAWLISGFEETYNSLRLPPLAPPLKAYSVIWGILYLLMGISAYLIYISDSPGKETALSGYWVQLGVSFIWPLLFFRSEAFLLSFFWILLLLTLILSIMAAFWRIRPAAGWLQTPHLIWIGFACYLNLGVWLLNK